jgi:methylamine dehydrogenase heavy chain
MQSIRTKALCATAALLWGAGTVATVQAQPVPPTPGGILQAEVLDVAVMPPATPRWFYVMGAIGPPAQAARIIDGDSGKMKGLIEAPPQANVALDPKGRYYYVAETIWTKGNRGTRQDEVSIYDVEHLKLVAEIKIPDRLLGGNNQTNFVISTNGQLAFVYTLLPSSIQVVDLEKRALQQTVKIGDCAALFPSGPGGVSALCANGSMATVSFSGTTASVSNSDPFFSATEDPVFDTVGVDRVKGVATFLSRSGKVYTATFGPTPKFSEPWSIHRAAGMQEPMPPPNVSWLPGGGQPFATNRINGRIYILMHIGEQFSHDEAGDEIWVLDGENHKLIGRHSVPGKFNNIQVSQEANPLVYVTGRDNKIFILDGETFETKHSLDRGGSGTIFVPDQS